MNRTTPASRIPSPALPRTGFNNLHMDIQLQVIDHAADPSSAITVESAWTIARFNAGLCTVSKRFQEHVQPYVHLSCFYTLAVIDREKPTSSRSFAVKQDLIRTAPRILYQRLQKMPDRTWSLTPVQRLHVWVDAHMGMATQEDFDTCLGALIGLVKVAAATPMAQLPYRAIPTLMAMFLCRSLTNPQGTAWHLSAVHQLMDALREIPDKDIAVPALLQIVVLTMTFESLGHPLIRLRTGNSQFTLSTSMVLRDLQRRALLLDDNEKGLRAVASVLATTQQSPVGAQTITDALHCLETLDHPLIGVWAAALNKLDKLNLTLESRQRLDRCVQKAEQNGWVSGAASPGQLLLNRA